MARLEERLPLALGRDALAEAAEGAPPRGDLARLPWVAAAIIAVLIFAAFVVMSK